jgi:hypothetical protein
LSLQLSRVCAHQVNVDERLSVPTHPNALFALDDPIGATRQFARPQHLFASLDRLFAVRGAR